MYKTASLLWVENSVFVLFSLFNKIAVFTHSNVNFVHRNSPVMNKVELEVLKIFLNNI